MARDALCLSEVRLRRVPRIEPQALPTWVRLFEEQRWCCRAHNK